MMWNVKAQFADRRSGVAEVVAGATQHGMALMALRTDSGWRGRIVDEIVLVSPGGWDVDRIEQHMLTWGATAVRATALDVDAPQAHEEAVRRARRAHPAGARWARRAMPAAS